MVVLSNWTRGTLRGLSAVGIGIAAWHGSVAWLAVAPAIVWMWAASNSRTDAFALMLCYYLAAARGLLVGGAVFFTDPFAPISWWAGIGVWIAPSLILASVWALLWDSKHQLIRLLVVLVILSLPPIGIIGWANPITSAGALFPGSGWMGLLGVFLVSALFCRSPPITHARTAAIVGFAAVAAVANVLSSPSAPQHWVAVDTDFGADVADDFQRFERLQTLQARVRKIARQVDAGTVIVLPEVAGGDWNLNRPWWSKLFRELEHRGQTVLVGAIRDVQDTPQMTENTLLSEGADSGKAFIERMPVPISMWKPFTGTGTRAVWLSRGIETIHGRRVAALVCYEQLLVWPVLASMTAAPEILVGVANGWWAKGTSVPTIQREVLEAWGRLFGVPAVYAANR